MSLDLQWTFCLFPYTGKNNRGLEYTILYTPNWYWRRCKRSIVCLYLSLATKENWELTDRKTNLQTGYSKNFPSEHTKFSGKVLSLSPSDKVLRVFINEQHCALYMKQVGVFKPWKVSTYS